MRVERRRIICTSFWTWPPLEGRACGMLPFTPGSGLYAVEVKNGSFQPQRIA
jgi:hypothetical protein